MSSDITFNKEYILSHIKDLRQLREESAEKASRIQDKKKKDFMCFAYKEYRHLTRDCTNKQYQEKNAENITENSDKKKSQKRLSKKKACRYGTNS